MARHVRLVLLLVLIGCGFLLLLTICESTEAATVIVAEDGSGDHTGLAQGIAAAESGDTVLVYDGSYYSRITIDKPLRIIGNGSSTTQIKYLDAVRVVYITADDVTLEGFRIVGKEGVESVGVALVGNYSRIANNLVQDAKYGIRLEGAHHNTIENNTFENNGESALITFTTSYSSYQGNRISGAVYGIKSRNSFRDFFENNTSSNNDIHGMYMQFSSSNVISRNSFFDNDGDGLVLYASDDNLLTRNNCTGNKNGIVIGNSAEGNILKHNVVYRNENGMEIILEDNLAYYNHIYSNTEMGLISSNSVDARFNWWGDGTGPYNQYTNSGGLGDAISNEVDYGPWLNRTDDHVPHARIVSVLPATVEEGNPVYLHGAGDDPDMAGRIVGYAWYSDLDGFLGSNSSIATQLSAGEHLISFQVRDDDEHRSEFETIDYIVEPRALAVLNVSVSEALVGDSIDFSGRDSLGRLREYKFDYGDGVDTGWRTLDSSIHEYTAPGTYTVKLWVRNVDGFISDEPDTGVIVIHNRPPVAQIISISHVPALEGHEVLIEGQGEDLHGRIVQYNWSSDLEGSLAQNRATLRAVLGAGVHNISLQVRDNDGAWSPWVRVSLLVQEPLVAALNISVSQGNVSEQILFNASGSSGEVHEYLFVFGDGTTSGWTTRSELTHSYQRGGIYRPELWVRNSARIMEFEAAYGDLTILVLPEGSEEDTQGVGLLNFILIFVVMVFLVFLLQRWAKWRNDQERY